MSKILDHEEYIQYKAGEWGISEQEARERIEKSASDEKSLVEMNKKERIQWYMENLGITEEQAQSIIIEKPEETREDEECLK